MYVYTKEVNKKRRNLLIVLCVVFIGTVSIFTINFMKKDDVEDTLVGKVSKDIPVITLPDNKEKAHFPFDGTGKIVLDYYGDPNTKIDTITEFEGVYRGNQGVDFSIDNTEFEVKSMFSGEVSDVKEDAMFGNSITVKTEHVVITYQSLKDVRFKIGDKVLQGNVLGNASVNIYNKDLGNHLHLVVESNGKRIDPKSILNQSLDTIE